MTRLVSGVYDLGRDDPPVGCEAEHRNLKARQRAWHQLGVVILDPEDITDDWLRQAVINEGEARYGKRRQTR